MSSLLENTAARFLHEVVAEDAAYRELLVADKHGRLVAASGITSDYYQADEDWWRHVVATGHASVIDTEWDESARAFGLVVAVPIMFPSGEGVAGVLKALVDTRTPLAD